MICLEDFKEYFFVVSEDPKTRKVHVAVQVAFNNEEKGKDSYIKEYDSEYFLTNDIHQAKALTMAEFLEKLNEANG